MISSVSAAGTLLLMVSMIAASAVFGLFAVEGVAVGESVAAPRIAVSLQASGPVGYR